MTVLMHDYILVEPVTEEKTKSGILLTIDTQNKQLVGTVKAIGKDIDDRDLEIGSSIIFDKLNSSQITIQDVEYTIIQYDDVIAIL